MCYADFSSSPLAALSQTDRRTQADVVELVRNVLMVVASFFAVVAPCRKVFTTFSVTNKALE
jgi:hypothetical protein